MCYLYRFKDFKQTYSNAVISLKLLENSKKDVHGILMYDVNGTTGPNTWGKDVFGLNVYKDKFLPFFNLSVTSNSAGRRLPFEKPTNSPFK